jgi:glutamine amidotransferase-like uncharacterized protein
MNLIRKPICVMLVACLSIIAGHAQGYYKDIFIDGGVKLNSMKRMPAADLLGLSVEYYASSRLSTALPPTSQDTLIQRELIVGNDLDLNGILLYPDGAPRFRLIYVNGGKAANHGLSLGEDGLSRIRQFVKHGGSFVGTCAGAFLSSAATIRADTVFPRTSYLQIWPGVTRGTGLYNSFTGMKVEKNSPLLRFNQFGGDMYIDSLRHNGGCYAWTKNDFPKETEVLLRYDYPEKINGKSIHNEISAWAYKENTSTGRVVSIGSHPETVTSGERLDLMAAMISYSLDGNGTPQIKGELEKGKKRNMYKSTSDNNPDSTMIGDKQYHHFIVEIPEKARNIILTLNGDNAYDLFLYMKKDDFAFARESDYKDVSPGAVKKVRFDKLLPGIWYVAVECYTTVDVKLTDWGYEYTGPTGVLNGVPYSLLIEWE